MKTQSHRTGQAGDPTKKVMTAVCIELKEEINILLVVSVESLTIGMFTSYPWEKGK